MNEIKVSNKEDDDEVITPYDQEQKKVHNLITNTGPDPSTTNNKKNYIGEETSISNKTSQIP